MSTLQIVVLAVLIALNVFQGLVYAAKGGTEGVAGCVGGMLGIVALLYLTNNL